MQALTGQQSSSSAGWSPPNSQPASQAAQGQLCPTGHSCPIPTAAQAAEPLRASSAGPSVQPSGQYVPPLSILLHRPGPAWLVAILDPALHG